MDLIKLNEYLYKYETDKNGMEKGRKIEVHGSQERETFLAKYPVVNIPNLTIEQYISFSDWLRNKLRHFANTNNIYPHDFEVFVKDSQIQLSKSYQKLGFDNKKAFNFLKNEIVNFLEDIRQENYNDLNKYKINDKIKNLLMIVYFSDRFLPVWANSTINKCLKSVWISFPEDVPMVHKNLALVKWKKTISELADWSNQMVLNFCLWLYDENIEEAKKIEEEINSLNVEGASKKAIINVRVNQGRFRDSLLERYNKCCLCEVKNQELLIASHIKPWAKSKPEEQLDVDNGFLMCPNHDKLFDKGYITFSDDGKIIISDTLPENERVSLNVNSKMCIKLTDSNKKYLKFHRKNIFHK